MKAMRSAFPMIRSLGIPMQSQRRHGALSWARRAGGGLAGGMDPAGTHIANEREQWEDTFETFEELKTQWIINRAKVMEVIKLGMENSIRF